MGLFEAMQLKKTKCLQITKENTGLAFWQSLAFTIHHPFSLLVCVINNISKEFIYFSSLVCFYFCFFVFCFLDVLLDAEEVQHNLFDILFKCQSVEVPWRHLLAHSIVLHRSLLSVLAACFQVSHGCIMGPCKTCCFLDDLS